MEQPGSSSLGCVLASGTEQRHRMEVLRFCKVTDGSELVASVSQLNRQRKNCASCGALDSYETSTWHERHQDDRGTN